MTSTREALREHDWADFRPTRRLGDSEWHMWGVGLLRSAGFPASGLDLLGGPAAAAAADRGDQDGFTAAYLADSAAETHRLAVLAGDEKVRTAIAWQNRTVYRVLDALAAGTGKESKRKQRERTLAMYWLRYCAKAETIGFFGPAAWMSVGRAPGVSPWTTASGWSRAAGRTSNAGRWPPSPTGWPPSPAPAGGSRPWCAPTSTSTGTGCCCRADA